MNHNSHNVESHCFTKLALYNVDSQHCRKLDLYKVDQRCTMHSVQINVLRGKPYQRSMKPWLCTMDILNGVQINGVQGNVVWIMIHTTLMHRYLCMYYACTITHSCYKAKCVKTCSSILTLNRHWKLKKVEQNKTL